MSKLIKRIMAMVMMFSTVFSSIGLQALAADDEKNDKSIECEYALPENNDSSSEYFEFIQDSNQRIDANGYFTFSYLNSMISTSFKPAASSMTIYVTATSSPTPNKTYYISLVEFDTDTIVKRVSFTANGVSQYYVFTGLDTSKDYYLGFSLPLFSSGTVTGSGHLVSIQ